jgi:hypothetical protein
MYSTCLFCHASLGANEVIERFPVGRRLAFDAAKGRLWVVCRKCGRWNLTPVEERWEAIEDAERLFRGTRTRVSTDEIGLAKLAEGLELVRVGKPLRPEFAAWRYGQRLTHLRRRAAVASGAGLAVGGAVFVAAAAVSATAAAFTGGLAVLPFFYAAEWAEDYLQRERVMARIRTEHGFTRDVRVKHIRRMEIVPEPKGADWHVRVVHDHGISDIGGPAARQTAAQLLAAMNRFWTGRAHVQDAVMRIERAGDAERYVLESARLREKRRGSRLTTRHLELGALNLTNVERLALEMAIHEDAERLAAEGELAELERAWREAEEVAAIADNMFLPASVHDFIARHRPR